MSRSAAPDVPRRFLASCVAAGWCPGASLVGRTGPGRCEPGRAGHASLEPQEEAASPGTPYDLASLTKPLATALLLVLLEQEGRLDPARPLVGVLEEFRGSPYGAASLLDLARHEARMPAWCPLYLEAADLPDVLRRIASLEPAAPPGVTLYSDLGYIALGAALERATGERLGRL